jgi:hypothetical protein
MNAPDPPKRRRGRPPKPEGEVKRASFQTRLHESLRIRLQEEAAKNGHSLSEEIERRLIASYGRVEDQFGGSVGLATALQLYANYRHAGDLEAHRTGHPEWTIADWLHDPNCFERALDQLIRTVWSAHPNETVTVRDFLAWLLRLGTRAWSAELTRRGLTGGEPLTAEAQAGEIEALRGLLCESEPSRDENAA